MKKLFFSILLLFTTKLFAANLLEVYEQAIVSDPVYQQNIANMLAIKENVNISLSSLLPNIGATAQPYLMRTISSGPAFQFNNSDRRRGYNVNLTITQTIFDYAQFANFAESRSLAKQASATMNAAAQDLMIRVSRAYFQILEDEDILRASESTKLVYAKQLDQVKQQYRVGIKTITDVYTAEASYEGSVADYIAAINTLENDRENLRAITGKLYPSLAKLSEKFPLIKPVPANPDSWVDTATKQNWQVRAAQYGAIAARQNIKQQFAGHFPTLNVQGSYDINFIRDFGGKSNTFDEFPPGVGQTHISTISANLAVPIFEGGLVLAETRQAKDNYRLSTQQLEQQLRTATNMTRQSYLGIIAGISKIAADRKAIQSSISSWEGMEAGYRVGTEILVNVLNQQEQVLINQKQYAADRYAYVNNLLMLKQAAGTLCPDDLAAINAWLYEDNSKLGPEIPAKAITQSSESLTSQENRK
jgi:outer membrane protein